MYSPCFSTFAIAMTSKFLQLAQMSMAMFTKQGPKISREIFKYFCNSKMLFSGLLKLKQSTFHKLISNRMFLDCSSLSSGALNSDSDRNFSTSNFRCKTKTKRRKIVSWYYLSISSQSFNSAYGCTVHPLGLCHSISKP